MQSMRGFCHEHKLYLDNVVFGTERNSVQRGRWCRGEYEDLGLIGINRAQSAGTYFLIGD